MSEALDKNVKAIDGYGSLEQLPIKSQGTPTACWFILVVELCERLAFYTFNGTLAFFLERAGFSLVNANSVAASMVTLCFLWPLLASWVADVVCGRFQTILVSGIVYIIGSAIAALATLPNDESIPFYFVGIIFLVPLATAGIKSNLSNLGADQYDESDPVQKVEQERFFSIFYLAINVGSFVAYGFMTSFATNGGLGIPRSYGYFTAYAIAAVCMLVATCIFFAGSHKYRKVPTQERSAIAIVADNLASLSRDGSKQAAAVCAGFVLLFASTIFSIVKSFVENAIASNVMVLCGFLCAAGGLVAIIVPCSNTEWIENRGASFEQHPSLSGTGIELADVKGFLDLLPVLMLGNVAFNALYNCMAFWYQQQACQMDLRMTPSIQLAGSFFNVADCIAIVVVTPLAVDLVNPSLEKRMNTKLGYGAKFGIGMGFGIASVVAAAVMEIIRRGAPVLQLPSHCAPPGVDMSNFPAVWMMLPYFLMGIGEIYCNPTLMLYAYSKSPVSMRTLSCAVSFLIQAVGSSLFALLLDVIGRFVPNNLNYGHMEYGYGISVFIGVVFYFLFLRVLP